MAAERFVPVENVMTRSVCTARPDQTLREIALMLTREHCHHVPILDGERLVGIVSSRDLVRHANSAEEGVAAGWSDLAAEKVMSTPVESIRSDESIERAIDRIGPGHLHALVVVDPEDRLVGIVTHNDLLDHLIG